MPPATSTLPLGSSVAVWNPLAAAMLLAGGAKFLLLSALLYAPGTLLYAAARREQGLALFSLRERLLFGVLCVAALAALVALFVGALSI